MLISLDLESIIIDEVEEIDLVDRCEGGMEAVEDKA